MVHGAKGCEEPREILASQLCRILQAREAHPLSASCLSAQAVGGNETSQKKLLCLVGIAAETTTMMMTTMSQLAMSGRERCLPMS